MFVYFGLDIRSFVLYDGSVGVAIFLFCFLRGMIHWLPKLHLDLLYSGWYIMESSPSSWCPSIPSRLLTMSPGQDRRPCGFRKPISSDIANSRRVRCIRAHCSILFMIPDEDRILAVLE